jgi:hypothetical protein
VVAVFRCGRRVTLTFAACRLMVGVAVYVNCESPSARFHLEPGPRL